MVTVFLGVHFLERIAPKAVLSSALNTAFLSWKIETRVIRCFFYILCFKWEGKYRADVKARVTNGLSGEIQYDVVINADVEFNRILAKRLICSGKGRLDADLYKYRLVKFYVMETQNHKGDKRSRTVKVNCSPSSGQ